MAPKEWSCQPPRLAVVSGITLSQPMARVWSDFGPLAGRTFRSGCVFLRHG